MPPNSIPAIMAPPRARDHPLARFSRSVPGMLGLGFLAVMFIACIATLPWTVGRVSDPSAPNSLGPPRYDVQTKTARHLPPTWWGVRTNETGADTEAARLQETAAATGSKLFYLMGTDLLGRDVFIRCLAGGGISLGIGIAAATLSVILGTLYGALAGYIGGRTDAVMMRIVDILYGLPYILLVVLLAVAVDGAVENWQSRHAELSVGQRQAIGLLTLLFAIGGVSWLTMARVVRGQVLSLKAQPFMEAARAMGVSVPRQFWRHLLPNLVGPIVVYATLTVPQAILQESFLSFLGIGVKPPMPSWGNLAADGLSELNPVRSHWWLLLFPCLLLGLTLLALNFVGEGLREALDPKRGRR